MSHDRRMRRNWLRLVTLVVGRRRSLLLDAAQPRLVVMLMDYAHRQQSYSTQSRGGAREETDPRND